MLLNYWIIFIWVFVCLVLGKIPRTNTHEHIISISSLFGTQLLLRVEHVEALIDDENFVTVSWFKGIFDLKPLISNSNLRIPIAESASTVTSRYQIVNRTDLNIEQTSLGDEGFYTLEVQTVHNTVTQYLYHVHYFWMYQNQHVILFFDTFQVILFHRNISLFVTSTSYSLPMTYHADQQINFTCSISLYADLNFMAQSDSFFSTSWYMIIYNHDPDYYELSSLSSIPYTYTAYPLNYELNQNDHQQTAFCALIQHDRTETILLNLTLVDTFNIEYKTYLYGNYYSMRSFNSYSTIEINCEEFRGNPPPHYTLLWVLNGQSQTLLNKSKHGRYLIHNATWRHRGNYTCLAENYLNLQPAHQSFRLNIWFHEHQIKLKHRAQLLSLEPSFHFNRNKPLILIFLITMFVFSCFLFILSLYYFCLKTK